MKFISELREEFSEKDYLWKYFDLFKFLYFIQEEKLFFTRADMLDDPNEALSDALILENMYYSGVLENETVHANFQTDEFQEFKRVVQENTLRTQRDSDAYQKGTFINCWTIWERESFAMWDLYASSNGVAIKMNANYLLSLLKSQVSQFQNDAFTEIVADRVRYKPFFPFNSKPTKPLSDSELRHTAFKKDSCYQHENEFRFIAYASNENVRPFFELPIGSVKELSFEIVFHPQMEKWRKNELKKLLATFKLEQKIVDSYIIVKKL